MAGRRDQDGAAGGDWLGPVFETLKAKVEASTAYLRDQKIEDTAGGERVARLVGVIARSARAVGALRQQAAAHSEEDEMGERTYDPEETERLRRELVVEGERLDRILEQKRAEGIERRRRAAGAALSEHPETPVSA